MKKSNNSKLKRTQKRKLKKLFIKAVVTTVLVSASVVGAGVFLYNHFIHDGSGSKNQWTLGKKPLESINTNLAVFGVDEDGYRTDVIFIVNFNSDTNKVKVTSIPRDTMIDWSPELRDKLMLYTGKTAYTTKINEMTSYSGIDNIREFTMAEIEDILDITIDNYVIVSTSAFRQLVDAIGGVEVEVPALENGEGLHYDDYYQDLHIHLEPGLQTLNGEEAEGLVRYRKGYAEGDVGRIKTQQIFLDAFADKILSPSTFTKLPQIASVIFDTVTTDIQLSEITHYLQYVKDFDTNNLSFHIVPGEAEYVSGKWYYVIDEYELPTFIDEVFHDIVPAGEEGLGAEEEIVEDKTVSIEVLNSTATPGLAAKQKAVLEAEGYSVSSVGNYTPAILDTTIIYAKDLDKAKQFEKYYEGAEILTDTTLQTDIQIVLGHDVE